MRIGRLLAVVVLVTGILAVGAVGAPSAGAVTQEFTASTPWTVPAGVTCVTFDLIGARGGNGGANQFVPAMPGAPGGLGGEVAVELAVTANATLTIDVGTRGGDGGGAIGGAPGGPGGGVGGGPGGAGLGGGGGGGGGASRVRFGAVDLEHEPGAGGIDESAGEDGDVPDGGSAATGGGGATDSAGGSAGVNGANMTSNQPTAGAGFSGGDGGSSGDGGGGGGGGLFGGGGGGAGFVSGGAGGGGGSNHAPGFASVTHGVDADNGGNGRVSVSYEVGDTSCIAAPLAITKVVASGAPEPGTIVTVTLSCTSPSIDPSTVGGSWADERVAHAVVQFTIGPDGDPLGGAATVGFGGRNSCTITETQTGGAVTVTYSCTNSGFQTDSESERTGGFAGQAVVGPDGLCSSAGPQATPITVDIVDPGQLVEVTVTNAYPPPVLIPRFTG
jgi:hypothetical protein